MFEVIENKAVSLQPLFDDDLQKVFEEFAEYTNKHGLSYGYSVYGGEKPIGLHPTKYRRGYDNILSSLMRNKGVIKTLSQKHDDLMIGANKIKLAIVEQQKLIDEELLWINSIDNQYAQAVLFDELREVENIENTIRGKQDSIKFAEIKMSGLRKALEKIEKTIRQISAIIEWLDKKTKIEAAEAAKKIYQDKLQQFVEQFRDYQAIAKRAYGVGEWVINKDELIGDVAKTLRDSV